MYGGAVIAPALVSGLALAAETKTYTYDALGRLVTATTAGGPNNGVQSSTTFDRAGNRTNQAVTGAPGGGVTFSVNSPSAAEGSAVVFTVTKSGTASGTLTVNYATGNGTAAAGSDYTAASGTLSFLIGDTSKTVSVATTHDTVFEADETLTLTLSAPSGGASIGTGTGTGTITNNDTAPSFSIANATAVTEGGTLVFTVTKTGSTAFSHAVNYATANGTATAGSDYTAASGTLTFAAGDTSKTINVVTTDDAASEAAETVLVNLSAPTAGATIATAQGSGTINDNDPANQPPTTVADTLSIPKCAVTTKNVTANDSDPEGNLPLVLLSATNSVPARGDVSVYNSTSVQYAANNNPGTDIVTYTVRDSLGATSNGTLTVTVTNTGSYCSA